MNLVSRSFVEVTNLSSSVKCNGSKEQWSVRFHVVCCGSLRFVVGTRQIKEKWLHVHIDFCPQFAGGYGGWSLRESTNLYLSLSPSLSLSSSVQLYSSISFLLSLCRPLLTPTPFLSLSLPFRSYSTPLSNSLLFPFARCIRLDLQSPLIFELPSNFTFSDFEF